MVKEKAKKLNLLKSRSQGWTFWKKIERFLISIEFESKLDRISFLEWIQFMNQENETLSLPDWDQLNLKFFWIETACWSSGMLR